MLARPVTPGVVSLRGSPLSLVQVALPLDGGALWPQTVLSPDVNALKSACPRPC